MSGVKALFLNLAVREHRAFEPRSTLDPDTGTVTAGSSSGDATLTATMKNVSPDDTVDGQIPTQSANIAVVAKTLESIEVQLPENLTLIPGQKVALSALGRYNDDSAAVLSNDSVTWSKDPAITVAFELIDNDFDGHVDTLQAVKAGSGSVKATSSGITDTSELITVDNATITDMAISPDIDELPVGFSQTFEAFVVADTGVNAKLDETQVSWEVTPKVGVSGSDNGDGTYTVESNSDGVTVTVTASLKADAFPDVSGNDLSKEETFTTVPADITNLVIEPLDGSTVVVGVPYRLRAEAVQNNGELFDATDKVDWTSDDTTVDIDEIKKTVTFLESGNDSVTLTATPNDAASFDDYTTPATSTVTVLKSEVKGIIVTPETSVMGTGTTQFKAYEYYSYGKAPVDVTELVTWSVEPLEIGGETYGVTVIASGEDAGLVTSSTLAGSVYIKAESVEGFDAQSTIHVFGMCGTGVDDTDLSNALGFCLKVVQTTDGLLTSTPNLATVDTLGLIKGDDYSYVNSTPEGDFVEFNFAENGERQYEDWCNYLGMINFGGENSWETSNRDELKSIFNVTGKSPHDEFGWLGLISVNGAPPTNLDYISNEIDEDRGDTYRIDVNNGTSTSYSSGNHGYASCIVK